MKKMDSMELNYIKDNSGSWNFSSNDQYVCFLSVLNDILPVVKFKISSAVSSYFSMELFVISQKKIDFNNIYKKEAVLCLFFDQTTKKYEKEIVAKIYKIYIQGESYFLNQQAISTSVKTYYYKIVLYPNLYELTFKERNYIHKGNSKANEVELIAKFDVAKKVLTSEYGYNLAIKSNGIILDEIKKEESITQYQESDYNFVLRILEDIDLILYYDFKDKTPNLIIASETSFAISEKIQLQKAQAIQQIYELDQIQELFISDNGQFNAICSSYNLFAGCVFSIENDSINSYFVIESDMFLEYKENGQWELKNYINGVIIGNKLLKKRAIPKLFTGTIRGIVVSNKKNTFNVDQNGRIQVRFLWNTQIFNKEGGKKQDINDNQKEIENGWDLNYNKSNVTTWIPLAHWGAAGRLYGNFNYPRSGSEVLISFYEGNLDLPFVIGSVFNANNIFPNVKSFNLNQKEKQDIEDKKKDNISSNNIKILPSDNCTQLPNISDAAGNLVFKHYSYDSSKETKTDRFNEISFDNNYEQEKIHIISSNLIDLRSQKDLHIQVDEHFRGVYESETEMILKKRDTYIFGEDFYTLFNNKRIIFLDSFESTVGFFNKKAILLLQMAKIEIVKELISSLFFSVIGNSFDLFIYDKASVINFLTTGNIVNISVSNDIMFALPMGTYSMLANIINLNIMGASVTRIAGYKRTNVLLNYNISVLGKFNIDSINFSILAMKMNLEASAGIDIKSGKIDIKCAKFDLDTQNNDILCNKFSYKTGKINIKAASTLIKCVKLNITCAEFSMKSMATNLTSTIFNLKGVVVEFKGVMVQL